MVKIAESLTGISFQRNEGMIKKSAFIVSQKSRLNMGKLGGVQRYKCANCGKQFLISYQSHNDADIIFSPLPVFLHLQICLSSP